MANEALSLPGTAIAFPAEVTVNVEFASLPQPGRYTLISGGVDGTATAFSLGTASGAGNRMLSLAVDADGGVLYLEARTRGLVISVQ